MKTNIYEKIIVAGAIAATAFIAFNKEESHPVEYEGFGKNVQILDAIIPTRGEIVRIKKLPGVQYDSTSTRDGYFQLTGPFEYQIKPSWEFMKEDDGIHTDKDGNNPHDSAFWTDVRDGHVNSVVTKSIDDKLKK